MRLKILAGCPPVLGIVPFRYQSWSNVADRYMYMPMLGAALCAAEIRIKGFYETTLLAAYSALLCAGSWTYVGNWENVVVLHSAAIKGAGGRILMKTNSLMILGMMSKESGQEAKAQRFFRQALQNDYRQK